MTTQPVQNQPNITQEQPETQKVVKDKIAKFPEWDILPKTQFINPRIKSN